jgi:hypothetical protein
MPEFLFRNLVVVTVRIQIHPFSWFSGFGNSFIIQIPTWGR